MKNCELELIMDGIRTFPIGEIAPDRMTLLCKAGIISYLARFQEQFTFLKNNGQNVEEVVKTFLGEMIFLKKEEAIPDVASAERYLQLPFDFLHDYSQVQYVKEKHPEFSQLYDFIFIHLEKQLTARKHI